jgi:hypothetical protein
LESLAETMYPMELEKVDTLINNIISNMEWELSSFRIIFRNWIKIFVINSNDDFVLVLKS